MGYLIDYLEEAGFVCRIPDPADRRAKLVKLTVHGEKVRQIAIKIITETEEDWSHLLGTGKMKQLRKILEELVEILE
jgi:DNA-binding MarR family transcriptional regulator